MTRWTSTARSVALCTLLGTAHAGLSHAQQAAPAPARASDAVEGKVTYYGGKFAERKTASGQRFNPEAMTMAHKSLPLGTQVRVTNLGNQRSAVVRVNDRGPTTPDRVGDLSLAAARKIGMLRSGVVMARLEVLAPASVRKGKKG